MNLTIASIPQSFQEEALRVATSPERVWSAVFVNYDTDFNEWFVNPFRCDPYEDGAVSVAVVDESTKTLIPA